MTRWTGSTCLKGFYLNIVFKSRDLHKVRLQEQLLRHIWTDLDQICIFSPHVDTNLGLLSSQGLFFHPQIDKLVGVVNIPHRGWIQWVSVSVDFVREMLEVCWWVTGGADMLEVELTCAAAGTQSFLLFVPRKLNTGTFNCEQLGEFEAAGWTSASWS